MRYVLFAAALCVCLAVATPSDAGTVSYADGRGSWQPKGCLVPTPPAEVARDPEAAANNLNSQITLHNAYVAAAEDYMNCISQEAQIDAQSSGQVITQSAQALIQKTQADVAASATRFQSRGR